METALDRPGTFLRVIPPREVLQKIPKSNRRKLYELNTFFAKNFKLERDDLKFEGKFGGLALALAMHYPTELELRHHVPTGLELLHQAVSVMALEEEITSLAPEKLFHVLDARHKEPAFFLSVLKALENKNLVKNLWVDGMFIRDLHSFQDSVFHYSHEMGRPFSGAAFLAILENQNCVADWVSEKTAYWLSRLSDRLRVRDKTENSNRFLLLAAALRKQKFAPEQLKQMASGFSPIDGIQPELN
jgi:hypothetical protein